MREEDIPSTSVLVDVVTVLGGDVITNGVCTAGEPEMVERLVAAAALVDIAQRILRETADRAVRSGLDVDQLPHIEADAANSARSVPGSPATVIPFPAG